MEMDSDYLQRQLKILADDMKDDDPDVAKAYLFIQHRLNQSFPDGDASRADIQDLLNEPQGRKHSQNLPTRALDQLFENKSSRKKIIKESKLSKWINKIINEELSKIKLKEAKFTSNDIQHKYDAISRYTGVRSIAIKKFIEDNNIDVMQMMMDAGQGKGTIRQDLVTAIVGKPNNPIQKKVIQTYQNKEIQESSSNQEIQDIANNLVDFLGGTLPTQNWQNDKRIIEFFKEQGLTDPKMVHQIYNRALKLNRG